ncbi:MAG: LysR family transcriptional regulator [Pseudomonadota bacterium]
MFIAVVDSGGIARAAEGLNVAKSAVSRRLSQMEARYGVRLIDRRPRVWSVTTAGQELYQRASRMVADADDLDSDFSHAGQSLSGPLTISVAREFGLAFLKPALFEFRDRHPEIDMTIDFDDRRVDLERENYDMAVRITGDMPSGLVAKHLGTSRHGLFVSPTYADTRALPTVVEDLSAHPLLHYGSARRAEWRFEAGVKTRKIAFQPALNSNCGPFLLDAAVRGLGIARLPDFLSEEAVRQGSLLPVLPELRIADWGDLPRLLRQPSPQPPHARVDRGAER